MWMGDRKTGIDARTRTALTHVPAVRGGLNLRRRGWAEDRPGRKFCGARGCNCDSFAFPADASVPIIFKNYTTIGEFLADAIGGSEVAAFAGGVTVGDELFDFVVTECALFAIAKLTEFGGVVVFEDGEDAVEGGEELLGGGWVVLAKFAFVDRDVGFADEIVGGGEGLRGVEVIGKAGVEIGGGFANALGHAGGLTRLELSLLLSLCEAGVTVRGAVGFVYARE